MTENRLETIRSVVARYGRVTVDPASLTEEQSLYDVGLTSHASVNVMLALEDTFDMEFPERLLKRTTFESMANLRLALNAVLGSEA